MAEENERYMYDPSMAAAVIFVVSFSLSGLYHVFQVIKFRSWYFIPFVLKRSDMRPELSMQVRRPGNGPRVHTSSRLSSCCWVLPSSPPPSMWFSGGSSGS
ncbi:hypothetical protein LB505_002574 [Fusarium chuoi]|nr:hypothetical protein LB505_002574 [Fusarium chuoi]